MSTWLPFCIRRDGPSWKQGYFRIPDRNLSVIDEEFKHSTEGSLAAAFGVLDGPAQSSWPFTIPRVGEPYQHYSLESICWTQGRSDSAEHNIRGVGQEHELYGSMVVNDNQIYWSARITVAIREILGRTTTLREHNEVAPTACPSRRILWTPLNAKIVELEDNMTQAEFNQMAEKWLQSVTGNPNETLAALITRINGDIGGLNFALTAHAAKPHAGGPHSHTGTVTVT